MNQESEITDPSKFFNLLIISTIVYVVLILIIIYYYVFGTIITEPDPLSSEYAKQQEQTNIEKYFIEKNKEPRSTSQLYTYLKNYNTRFTNYFKTTITWFNDNKNFFIVLFSGFGFTTLILSWINYYDAQSLDLLNADTAQQKKTNLTNEFKASKKKLKEASGAMTRAKKKEEIIDSIKNRYADKNNIVKTKTIEEDISKYNNESASFNKSNEHDVLKILNIGLYTKVRAPFLWVTGLTILILLLFLITFTSFKLEYVQIIINVLILIGFVSLLYEKFEEFQSEIGIAFAFFIIFSILGGWILGTLFGLLGYCIGYYMNLYIQKNKEGFKHYEHIIKFINLTIGFLPCLFISFAKWIKEDYLKTSKNTLILLGIEALLLVFKFLIPALYSLFKKIMSPSENILLVDPVPLDRVTNLGLFLTNEDVKLSNTSKLDTSEKLFNYDYAVTFWLWIFPQPKSVSDAYNKSSNLINISDIVKVIYNKNTIEFWASTTKQGENPNRLIKLYEFKALKYQTWNKIVINYQSGTLDLLINKTLVSSTPNITPLKNNNNAVVGETNGINGGIKKVSYFKSSLSQQDINLMM